MIQAAFHEGHLTEECTWNTVVLILKGNGYFQGIGLVEVLWKTVMGIMNFHLTAATQFHDTLHGFHTRRGTRTASLESNLIQQVTAMPEEVLYEKLLELHKACNALDRYWCLNILTT